MSLHLPVNGERQQFSIDTRTSLLDLLREHCARTDAKKGCDHGQCGACTVLVDGRRVLSCLTLAALTDGSEVVTAGGLAEGDDLHEMQTAFVECDGFQCGFCTPGQLCSAVGLMSEWEAGEPSVLTATQDEHPDLVDEVRERMSGNLCRCGAYANIARAIAGVLDEQRPPAEAT